MKGASTASFSRAGTVQRIRSTVSVSKASAETAKDNWESNATMGTKSSQLMAALNSALSKTGTLAKAVWEKDQNATARLSLRIISDSLSIISEDDSKT